MESNLFVDPYETPSMPSIVRESLAQGRGKVYSQLYKLNFKIRQNLTFVPLSLLIENAC